MGKVFKKQYTKPIPEGAEIALRGGETVAKWRNKRGKLRIARVTTGEDGQHRLLLESKTWYARYRDHANHVVEESTGCRDEVAARQKLTEWERQTERIKAGIATPAEQEIVGHRFTPIEDHFAAYDRWLRSRGKSEIHRRYSGRYLRRLAKECGFAHLADLKCEALEKWLAGREEEKIAAKTRNIYRGAIVAFCNWAVKQNRLTRNPFVRAPVADVDADRRRIRRSMMEEELIRLLDVARQRPLLNAMTVRKGPRRGERYGQVRDGVRERLEALGRERALIYKTLLLCGLRKGELTALTVANVFLDEETPVIRLDAAKEKKREGNALVLREDLAADLRQWLADKLRDRQDQARSAGEPIPSCLPSATPLFNVPTGLLRVFNRDLKMAKIPKKDDRGRTLDVHAPRTTLSTLLSRAGVAPGTAQEAMRHSDINLTMQTYTDPKVLNVRDALDRLPALPLNSRDRDGQQTTGGDGTQPPSIAGPPRLAQKLAETTCKPSQIMTIAGNGVAFAGETEVPRSLAVTSTPDKRNDPPSVSIR